MCEIWDRKSYNNSYYEESYLCLAHSCSTIYLVASGWKSNQSDGKIERASGFPKVVGVIDGTHIKIIASHKRINNQMWTAKDITQFLYKNLKIIFKNDWKFLPFISFYFIFLGSLYSKIALYKRSAENIGSVHDAHVFRLSSVG